MMTCLTCQGTALMAGASLLDYSVNVFDDEVFDVSGHGADGRRVAARLLGERV